MLNKMTIEALKKVADMTERNHHGEAREYIAKQFEYCGRFAKIFNLLNEIHRLEGHLPFTLMNYRIAKTDEMLEQIEKLEGREAVEKIYQVI